MNSLLKQMKQEKTPQLKKYITLPLLLSPDRDEELLKLTEHRYLYIRHPLSQRTGTCVTLPLLLAQARDCDLFELA